MAEANGPQSPSLLLRLGLLGHLPWADAAPLLDTLNERHGTVEAVRWNSEPPAAGGPDVSMTLTISEVGAVFLGAGATATAIVLKTWLEEAAKESWQPVRRQLLRLFKKAPKDEWRPYVPMQVHVGSVRFYFEDPVTDEEFCKRLRGALEVADALPLTGLDGSPGPGEYGLQWDEAAQSWAGSIITRDALLTYRDGKLQVKRGGGYGESPS